MSSAEALSEPNSHGWKMRLGTTRRRCGITPGKMARLMGCSKERIDIFEQSGKSMMISDLWRYAIALHVSPEMLIYDATALVFGEKGNVEWLKALRKKIAACDWHTNEEAVVLTLSSIVAETYVVQQVDALGFEDEAMAALDAKTYCGPYHFIEEAVGTESKTVRVLARHLSLSESELRAKIRPNSDMRIEEFERYVEETGVPIRVLFRGFEFSENVVSLRTAMLKLAKYIAHLFDIVPAPAKPAAKKFLEQVALAGGFNPRHVSPFPKNGVRRTKDEVSPLEERSIPDSFGDRGFGD